MSFPSRVGGMAQLDPDQVVKSVGTRIAALRRERGLTQEALADELGISPGYVRKVELGRTNMTLFTLVRWANWLGVGLGEIVASNERSDGTKNE